MIEQRVIEFDWGHITRTKADPIEIVRGGANFHIGYVGGENALEETRKIELYHNQEVWRLRALLVKVIKSLGVNGTKPWLADEIEQELAR